MQEPKELPEVRELLATVLDALQKQGISTPIIMTALLGAAAWAALSLELQCEMFSGLAAVAYRELERNG